jgi:hypothetical protein
MTNPAGAQIINAIGPIRRVVDPSVETRDERRYLVVLTVEDDKVGPPVQFQRPALSASGRR